MLHELIRNKPKIIFFGNFGTGNFGNEGTLQAIHLNLRRLVPEAEFACVCTFPANASATHDIIALPISAPVITAWKPKNRGARLIRTLALGIPSELYRWYKAFAALQTADALIVPGTGLLTDAFGLSSWGPYNIFKWSLLARLCGCKLFFVSVGAGPLHARLSRFFVKSALSFADFRSYRDNSSREYLRSIGFLPRNDRVYPDLAFSLPKSVSLRESQARRSRPVVGLGLMHHDGMYGENKPDNAAYANYIQNLLILVEWLLEHEYDIRLLIGQLGDPVLEFRRLLDERLSSYDSSRIIDDRITSVEELLLQFSDTEFVVATRFHNVLFALLNNKPTISISFHHKCTSLMSAMGLMEYCVRIDQFKADDLINKVLDIEMNFERLKSLIVLRNDLMRDALEEQYKLIVSRWVARK
jgi:polysaccharide pyruvyl transferase WcaK-like protein